MAKITGNEPFHPSVNQGQLIRGITLYQEAVLRFMIDNVSKWNWDYEQAADQANIAAKVYIKSLNNG